MGCVLKALHTSAPTHPSLEKPLGMHVPKEQRRGLLCRLVTELEKK